MKKGISLILACLVILVSVSYPNSRQIRVRSSDAYPVHNLNTGLNYTTIQSAIDANETLDGHTIFVEQGKYYEHLIVNKSVSLIGENMNTTIIDGNFTGDPIAIVANHVSITNFTIQEGWLGTWYVFEGCAIYIAPDTSYANITHNIITDNRGFGIIVNYTNHNVISENLIGQDFGVSMAFSDNNTISDNIIRNSSIIMYSSHNNLVFDNNIENSSSGISIANSNGNLIYNNTIFNGHFGIGIGFSEQNRLYNNNMTGNVYNFELNVGPEDLTTSYFNNSIETSNLVDGKQICYLQHAKDVVIDPKLNIGTVYVIDSENITIRDLNLTHNGVAVYLWETKDSTIENITGSYDFYAMDLVLCTNITIDNCSFANYEYQGGNGIYINSSDTCSIFDNEIRYKTDTGIEVQSSSNMIIDNNKICNIWGDGLRIFNGGNNTICRNLITKNYNNVFLYFTSGNKFYDNDFEDDRGMFLWNATDNMWDNGFEGNYWSNYNGTDVNQDGIGDSAYTLLDGSIDHYPLMGMFYTFKTDLGYNVDLISNSTIEKFEYSEPNDTINLQVTNMFENQTNCFSRMTIPVALMNEPYHIFINGTEKTFKLLSFSNASYSYLYAMYDFKANVTRTNVTMWVNIWPQLQSQGYAGVDIRLYDDVPIATANFINLTKMGIYNNTIFFKAINNSIVEGGDPTGTGYGDPSIASISSELPNRHSNLRGTFAMAKNLGSNLTTSLFYVNLANNSFLDDQCVVFGEVTQGMYVFDTIGNATVDANDRPLLNYTIGSIDLIQHSTVDVVIIPEIPSNLIFLLLLMEMSAAIIFYKKHRP